MIIRERQRRLTGWLDYGRNPVAAKPLGKSRFAPTRKGRRASAHPLQSRVMPIEHYENFPVASILLPAHLRYPVGIVYQFARQADDLADEGVAVPAARLAALKEYDRQLERIALGEALGPIEAMLFGQLRLVIDQYALQVEPFRDLLSAFSQDVVVTRYPDFESLRDYCSRSANPVGRLMLMLHRRFGPENVAMSDNICTGLQLANFWQDVAVDWAKGRIYIPQDDMKRFAVSEEAIASGSLSDGFHNLLAFEIDRTRGLLKAGAPLAGALPGRIGWELRLVVQGGLRILEKIEGVRNDIFAQRPQLTKRDWLPMLWRARTIRA